MADADQNENESVLIADDMCVTDVDFRKCTYIWVINHFMSVHNKRKRILKSKPFSASDDEFKWLLLLNYSSNNSNTMSLQLHPDRISAGTDKHLPILGKLRSSVMNNGNQETNTKNTEFYLGVSQSVIEVSNFVDVNTLLNQNSDLLPQDRLTIFCEVSYIKETDIVNISAGPFSNSNEEREPDCLDGIESLLMNEEFSDVTLIVEGKKYPAHKSILVGRSPVFRAAFTHDMEEKQTNSIEIQDINVATFKEMLRYIYTGKVENMKRLAPELLAAADKYDLKNLKIMCEKELYSTLYSGTAVSTLILADLHHAENLKKQALLFMKIHSYTLNEEEKNSLLESYPHLLLEIINIFSKPNRM